MSHTPGPWFAAGKHVRGLASGQIATVGGDFYDDGRKDADGWTFSPPLDTAANAALISAAPDLLAAARLANQELIDLGQGSSGSPALAALWAAIAKAEGRE